MNRADLVLGALSLAAVTAVFLWETGRTSPGPLSPTHAEVPDLDGGDACERCHGESGEPAAGCGGCHEQILADLETGSGFHGRLQSGDNADCARCHVEHHGDGLPLTGNHAFREAGFAGGMAGYDHRGLRIRMEGRHAVLGCGGCHPLAGATALPAGERRFAGLSPDCFACHEADYLATRAPDHRAAGFPRSCESCHGVESFRGASFDHGGFPLEGAHRRASCAQCHEAGRFAGTAKACAGCHLDDYRATRGPNHSALGYPLGCGTCHGTESFSGARFRHRFPIERGKHRRLRCADCHDLSKEMTAFTCTDCHEHRRGEMDKEHRRVRGYRFDDPSCYRCHPTGEKD